MRLSGKAQAAADIEKRKNWIWVRNPDETIRRKSRVTFTKFYGLHGGALHHPVHSGVSIYLFVKFVRKKLDEARDRRFQREHQGSPMTEIKTEDPSEKQIHS